MKNVKQMSRLFFSLLCMGVLLTACSTDDAEDGMTGPQGEQGIQGIPGENGADGVDGTDGEDGNANVIYSEWIPADWADPITDDFDQFELDAPQLNEVLQDSGVVLVYARQGNLIYPIPVTFFGNIDENYNWRLLTINDDIIAVRINSTDGSVIGTPFLNDEFRYVLIPGNIPADDGRTLTAQDYENMTYEQVAEIFNIKD